MKFTQFVIEQSNLCYPAKLAMEHEPIVFVFSYKKSNKLAPNMPISQTGSNRSQQSSYTRLDKNTNLAWYKPQPQTYPQQSLKNREG